MQSPRSATALPSHDSYVIQISKLGQFGLNMMVFVCIVSAYFSPIVMNVIVNVCDPSVSKDLSIFVPIPRGDSTVSSLRRSFCFPSAALAIHCPFGVPGGRLASANRRTWALFIHWILKYSNIFWDVIGSSTNRWWFLNVQPFPGLPGFLSLQMFRGNPTRSSDGSLRPEGSWSWVTQLRGTVKESYLFQLYNIV